MKLRIILSVLALLAFLSALAGGLINYSSSKKLVIQKAELESKLSASKYSNFISTLLKNKLGNAKALAKTDELIRALKTGSKANITDANAMLVYFNYALESDVCYLMDNAGNTISSSNFSSTDSFIGKNYGFRPYFQKAIKGYSAIYLALGVTSGKRGAYFSHPIYDDNSPEPIGVFVIKTSADTIENSLNNLRWTEEDASLIAPPGIIFMSTNSSWLYHSISRIDDETRAVIAETKQFGKGPWIWAGLKRKSENRISDRDGNEYIYHQIRIKGLPGWKLLSMINLDKKSKLIIDPAIKLSIFIIFGICFLLGIAIIILFRMANIEISKRKQAEEAIKRSEKRYRNLYNNTPAMLHSIDNSEKLVSVSDFWCEILGYSREEALGRSFMAFLTEESRKYATETVLPDFFRKGYANDIEYQFVKKNGEVIDILLSAILEKDENGDAIQSLAVLYDITDRKQTEEQIKASLKEKETLLQEIHHRVKNNMNVVSSLLSLNKYSTENEEVKKALQESRGRIYAMSAVHETLYNSKNLAEIDLMDYLNKLSNSLVQTYSIHPGKVQLKIGGDDAKINIDKASPLGLTVNELISNALKYAFPDGGAGVIKITVIRQNSQIILTISDNGVGLPDGLDWKNSNTLGFRLVRNLIEKQLNGSVEIENRNGTIFTLKIPIEA